jgi:GMP synthase (glutamine-hydrolysing)
VRVLTVVHDPSSLGGGGLFDDEAAERATLDRWIVPDGGRAAPPERYDAIMVFGGAQHPDQDDAYRWIPEEVAYLRSALEARVPLLGVCLGSQLIARAAGAWVGRAESPEIGWHAVDLCEAAAADPVLGSLPVRLDAFQWHYYTFELPEGAVELAASPAARQAYRLGDRTWGIQFHAEITRPMLELWVDEGPSELPKPAAEVLRETDGLLPQWNEHGRRLCHAFLDAAAALRGDAATAA